MTTNLTECDTIHRDINYLKYVGYDKTVMNNENYQYLYKKSTLELLQKKITELLQGVDRSGRDIIVPIDKIAYVVSQCQTSNNPIVGDIYSRYIIQGIEEYRDDVQMIIDRTINIIVSQIRNELEIEQNNKELTIWTTVLGDFNVHGLRQHPPIKTRKRGPDRSMYMMNF